MKISIHQSTLAFSMASGILLVVLNIAIFTLSFPGLAAESEVASLRQNHLPAQRDVYRPTPPPTFLSELNLRAADISVDDPEPLPMLRYHSNDLISLASLTKLMTALVVIENKPNWSSAVTIKEADQRGGAKPRIFPGEKITIRDLWHLMLVSSDNDATVALVYGLNLEEQGFVKLMNEHALKLGLTSTHFVEPTGLSTENVSTAREFAVIARHALSQKIITDELSLTNVNIKVDGEERRIFSSDQQFKNFRNAEQDGWIYVAGKTGHVDEAGYNVAILSRNNQGAEILAVILGSPTSEERLRATDRLIKWAFGELSK